MLDTLTGVQIRRARKAELVEIAGEREIYFTSAKMLGKIKEIIILFLVIGLLWKEVRLFQK